MERSAILDRLRSLQFHFTKKLLFSWIKPTILGCDKDFLNIQPNDRVCYVMPFRSIADLMVVDQACADHALPRPYDSIQNDIEARAFFFLGRPYGAWGRKSQQKQSKRMARLFEHQTDDIAAPKTDSEPKQGPIKIVPVSLFWGHQPNREKSLSSLLLSDNWTVTSRFKKLLAMAIHPGHILVQFSEPVVLTDIIEDEPNREKQIRRLLRLLRVHFNHQKLAILGPDLSHRRTLINAIMSDDGVQESIKLAAEDANKPVSEFEKQALKHANEIVSHQSYRVIRFFHVLLTWFWNKLYNGVDLHNINSSQSVS